MIIRRYLSIATCLGMLMGLMVVSSCRHYHFVTPTDAQFHTIAIGPVENKTDEPRLTVYTKRKLSELITLDGAMKISRFRDAEGILHTNILSYTVDGIGEVQIESADSDQRKFRSSVFRVHVTIEYSVTDPIDQQVLVSPQEVHGIAEFNELVDLDIVKRDGLRRAIYDACDQIVSLIVDAP